MLRIVQGRFAGRIFRQKVQDGTRPSSDAIREALFNILKHGLLHQPLKVLDCFAGTGIVTAEFFSAGAQSALLFEKNKKAISAIDQSLNQLKASSGEDLRFSVEKSLKSNIWMDLIQKNYSEFLPFDTFFWDPPYREAEEHAAALKKILFCESLFAPRAVAILELSKNEATESFEAWELLKERVKGKTKLLFYRRKI